MKQNIITDFIQEINDIEDYIAHINHVNEISKYFKVFRKNELDKFTEHIHEYKVSKRIFEYKAIIISLYGILERYINILIREHIEAIPTIIERYIDFPEKLKEKHLFLSIKMLSSINDGKKVLKNMGILKEDILNNLTSCTNNNVSFRLNKEAFLPNSGNLKHNKIVESFQEIDIKLNDKLRDTDFSIIRQQSPEIVFNLIDDLVDRRNDIAHGSDIDEILGNVEIERYIEFLKKYGKALFNIIDIKEIEYESIYKYTHIEEIKAIFCQGSILCFEIENYTLKVGEYIIIKGINDIFYKKKILEIQVKNIPYDEIVVNQKCNVAVNLGVDTKMTTSQTFYVIQK